MSTRTKLILLVFCSLLLLTVGAVALTLHTTERAMIQQQAENAKNSVSLAVSNVAREYELLFSYKTAQAQTLRQSMLSMATTLQRFAAMGDDTFAFLRKFPLPDGVILCVLDESGKQLYARGGPETFNPYVLQDIKGQQVFESAMRLARADLPATCVVHMPNSTEHERVYGRHFYLADKKLLIGLWQDVSVYEKSQQDLWEKNMASLGKYFSTISIGPSGRLFVVDGYGNVVIGPEGIRPDLNIPGPDGDSLFKTLTEAVKTPETPLITWSSAFTTGGDNREVMIYLQKTKQFDWIVGGISYMDESRAPGKQLSTTLVLGILAAMLIILPFTVWFLDRVTSPLTTLANYARQVPDQNFLEEAPPLPTLETLAAGSTTETAELARSFLFMDATLRARVRELMENTSQRERMQGELAAATEIQNGFLPNSLLADEARGRFSLLASLVPARAVGGDLYDYFMLDDDTLCFVIGDVSDKGVPAALFMSMTLSFIRSTVYKTSAPNELMQVVNGNLAKDNAKCMFVTLFIGMLHLPTGLLRYANGGHNPPLLLREGQPPQWMESCSEPIVGAMEDLTYTQMEMQLVPGDTLFLYTDGLNEAMDANLTIYGNDRMVATLENASRHPERSILSQMLQDVADHVGDTPPSDDMTILCVHYTSKAPETRQSPDASY